MGAYNQINARSTTCYVNTLIQKNKRAIYINSDAFNNKLKRSFLTSVNIKFHIFIVSGGAIQV